MSHPTKSRTAETREDLYPSRVDERPQILQRIDPVVHGEDRVGGPLTTDQTAFFDQNGYLFFPGFFSIVEINRFFDELVRLSESPGIQEAKETVLEPDSREVRSIFHVHQTNPLFRRLSREPRIVNIVSQLLGGAVYIHQSRINYKPGFRGKEFYWHSDFETWHVEDGMPHMRAVSCSITFTENNPYNGPLMLIPGSHKYYVACVGETPADHYKVSLRKQDYGIPDHDSLRTLVDRGGITMPLGPVGSMILFDCNMMHGSSSNITPWPRSNIFFVYNSMDNVLEAPYGNVPPRPPYVASRDFTPIRSDSKTESDK